ncbi:hypothetical protein [Streptomyces broussonetiae]|uniref:Uncharacterized protein n=1 Tax=Streptomyces broussonetiae TaxID=2686304 RepID=A0A6I6N7B9_9ACTN|nr:hypothetical protein [Streptomyces broussonetiae]QHA06381.1 hypothetical protein GQF42_26615 [Streptomyces broussonetiae]
MTFPAAIPGTAVRVPRTAAGRRALQLALLVGALFALGFLCGEQAHAADGPPVRRTVTTVRETVTSEPETVTVTSVRKAATSARTGTAGHGDPVRAVLASGTGGERLVDPVRAGGEQSVTPVRAVGEEIVTPVRAVGDEVVTPVRTVGDKAVGSVRNVVSAVTAVSRPVVQASAPTTRPTMPALPLPDLGQVAHAPVRLPPGAKALGQRPHAGPLAPARSAASAAPHQRHTRAEGRTAATASAPFVAYGPAFTPASQTSAHAFARHGAAARVPGRPAPSGDPDGVLGKQAVDGNASRHGDAHAVTFGNRAPLRLVPGTAARVDTPRTRERHRDIPVFPG